MNLDFAPPRTKQPIPRVLGLIFGADVLAVTRLWPRTPSANLKPIPVYVIRRWRTEIQAKREAQHAAS